MEIRWVKRRVSRSSSSLDSFFGSTVIPPLAPPKGMSMSAVFHLIVVGVRVVPDAALAGTARSVVLDAVPREHLDPTVVHANRGFHLDLAERAHEDAPHVRVEVDKIGGALELTLEDGPPRHRGARRSAGC